MNPRRARVLLGGVLGLALVEWLAGAFAYRARVADEDWAAVADAIDPNLRVYVATRWLEPVARLEIGAAAELEAVARPDLRGQTRFQVLGLAGDRWSAALERDLEDLPEPSLESSTRHGGLELTTYTLSAGEVSDALLAHADELSVETKSGPCRWANMAWKCGKGRGANERVAIETVEVDYRPRRCLSFELDDGERARVQIEAFEFGNVLRGHVGFHDFNARLRSDAPVVVEAHQSGELLGRWTFTDAQGWAPFAVATRVGSAPLEIVLAPTVRGSWGRQGYGPSAAHRFCIEARGFTEGGA